MIKKEKTFLTIILFAMMPLSAFSQPDGFTVSGSAIISKTGVLYMEIVTEDEFSNNEKSHGKKKSSSGEHGKNSIALKITEKDVVARKVNFEFKNIPKGSYAIQGFIDENGNGILDEGILGPKEPWGVYKNARPKLRGPEFEEMKFDVNGDMKDVTIEME